MKKSKHLSVTEVNTIAKELLENSFMPLWMEAEIGTLMIARSGHVYMTLKDSKSQVRAVMFGGAKVMADNDLQIGSAVEVFGQLSLYVGNGEFQFKVQMIRPCGEGDLQKRFEQIKQKLLAEGLLDESRKRPLPSFSTRIGVVTSPDGAALHDFIQVLTRRFPPVHLMIYPSQVQGKSAHKTLIKGIEFFNRMDLDRRPDVLVLTRGGGSIEDLWSFNEESLARAVAASEIPVISAVGHEIDFTIADFVADFRAPTPSAAAEQVIAPFSDFVRTVKNLEDQLSSSAELGFRRCQTQFERLENRLEKCQPLSRVREAQQRVDQIELRMQQAVSGAALRWNHRLAMIEQRLESANPDTVINRGYAYLKERESGALIGSISQLRAGMQVTATLRDGSALLEAL